MRSTLLQLSCRVCRRLQYKRKERLVSLQAGCQQQPVEAGGRRANGGVCFTARAACLWVAVTARISWRVCRELVVICSVCVCCIKASDRYCNVPWLLQCMFSRFECLIGTTCWLCLKGALSLLLHTAMPEEGSKD